MSLAFFSMNLMEPSSYASVTQRLGASPLPMSSGARMVRSPQPQLVLCLCTCALWGFCWEGNVLAFLDANLIFRNFFLKIQLLFLLCGLNFYLLL